MPGLLGCPPDLYDGSSLWVKNLNYLNTTSCTVEDEPLLKGPLTSFRQSDHAICIVNYKGTFSLSHQVSIAMPTRKVVK